eukprot:781870-Alexandrium_andersonii.AAC.1
MALGGHLLVGEPPGADGGHLPVDPASQGDQGAGGGEEEQDEGHCPEEARPGLQFQLGGCQGHRRWRAGHQGF